MNTEKIEKLLHEAAEEIRRYAAAQVEAWRTVPYWTIESEGRGGWNGNWGLPYKYGLLGVDPGWPHYVFVELSSGRLIRQNGEELVDASDDEVIGAFNKSPGRFNAMAVVAERIQRATDGRDTYNKVENDKEREKLRERFQIPLSWVEPAKPIRYAYLP